MFSEIPGDDDDNLVEPTEEVAAEEGDVDIQEPTDWAGFVDLYVKTLLEYREGQLMEDQTVLGWLAMEDGSAPGADIVPKDKKALFVEEVLRKVKEARDAARDK